MNIFFDNCSSALCHASDTKTFGVFHSKLNNPNRNIHTHECCEVLLCISGGKNFLIDDKIYEVNPGDLFIINQFEAHKITFLENCEVERYILQIHPEFIFSVSTDKTDLSQCFYSRGEGVSNCISLDSERTRLLRSLFEALRPEHAFGDDILKNSTVMQLLALINEQFLTGHKTAENHHQNTQLKHAIFYINSHLSENMTLEQIAKSSYISVNQLCKLFKSALGTTVMKYIIGKRISEAKKHLKNGCSVSETALLCGFGDYSNFIRSFTKSVGISPGRYKSSN